MRFTKMQGCGNDFLIFDPGEVEGKNLPDLARKACDRHFGVGADGILIPALAETADLEMVYFNSDGSTSEMCGNGLRCLARYAKDRGMVGGEAMTITTGAGVKKVLLFDDGSSRVEMGAPGFDTEVGVGGFRFLRVSMGNPHAVAFLESEAAVETLDLPTIGPSIEENPIFPEKTNVEFGFARSGHDVRMRIWERGAGETLASGSGSACTSTAA
jgi:diaminopimelate epimerase